MIITFCGHSDYSTNANDGIRLLELIENISQGKQIDFYWGGYGNFDDFALNCTRKYKQSHPYTNIIFITPYLDKWLNERKDFIEKNTIQLFILKLSAYQKNLQF